MVSVACTSTSIDHSYLSLLFIEVLITPILSVSPIHNSLSSHAGVFAFSPLHTSLSLYNLTFQSYACSTGRRGAIYVTTNSSLPFTLTDSSINYCLATSYAVYCAMSSLQSATVFEGILFCENFCRCRCLYQHFPIILSV